MSGGPPWCMHTGEGGCRVVHNMYGVRVSRGQRATGVRSSGGRSACVPAASLLQGR